MALSIEKEVQSDSRSKSWKTGLALVLPSEITSLAKTINFYVEFVITLDNNLGHGSFLLSNNSYMWSHAFAANNIQNSGFVFVEGNIIKI